MYTYKHTRTSQNTCPKLLFTFQVGAEYNPQLTSQALWNHTLLTHQRLFPGQGWGFLYLLTIPPRLCFLYLMLQENWKKIQNGTPSVSWLNPLNKGKTTANKKYYHHLAFL